MKSKGLMRRILVLWFSAETKHTWLQTNLCTNGTECTGTWNDAAWLRLSHTHAHSTNVHPQAATLPTHTPNPAKTKTTEAQILQPPIPACPPAMGYVGGRWRRHNASPVFSVPPKSIHGSHSIPHKRRGLDSVVRAPQAHAQPRPSAGLLMPAASTSHKWVSLVNSTLGPFRRATTLRGGWGRGGGGGAQPVPDPKPRMHRDVEALNTVMQINASEKLPYTPHV